MSFFKFDKIKISAIASAVPTSKVQVDCFEEHFGKENIERFKQMTGVHQFRKTGTHQTTSDLGYVATEKIIQRKQLERQEIGALVFMTQCRDYIKPSTACVLHKRLRLSKTCLAFDVGLGCSSFVYGIQIVSSLMSHSDIKKAILIVGDTGTKLVSERDRATAMLFGDAASSILFEKVEEKREMLGELFTDGEGYKAIITPAGGFRNRTAPEDYIMWEDGNERTLYQTNMNGMQVFSFAIADVSESVMQFMKKHQFTVEQFDLFAFHQASKYIHEQLSKRLHIPSEKMPICLDRYGNTSGSSIPLLLSDYLGKETQAKELHVLLCGFGIGLSWGIVSAALNQADVYSVEETDEYFEEGIIMKPEDL